MGIIDSLMNKIPAVKKWKETGILIKGHYVSTEVIQEAYCKKHNLIFKKYNPALKFLSKLCGPELEPISVFRGIKTNLPEQDKIISFGKEGYWLNEIIMLNLDKDIKEINNVLEKDNNQEVTTTILDGRQYVI